MQNYELSASADFLVFFFFQRDRELKKLNLNLYLIKMLSHELYSSSLLKSSEVNDLIILLKLPVSNITS